MTPRLLGAGRCRVILVDVGAMDQEDASGVAGQDDREGLLYGAGIVPGPAAGDQETEVGAHLGGTHRPVSGSAPALLCRLAGDAETGGYIGPGVTGRPEPGHGLADGVVQLGGDAFFRTPTCGNVSRSIPRISRDQRQTAADGGRRRQTAADGGRRRQTAADGGRRRQTAADGGSWLQLTAAEDQVTTRGRRHISQGQARLYQVERRAWDSNPR